MYLRKPSTGHTGSASVTFDGVDIDFPIYSAHGRSLKRSVLRFTTGGRIGVSEDDRVVVSALRGVTFSAVHGERIGLIGHNGSGKSTMLRTAAGVYEPPRGVLTVNGRVASLIDLTLGMDMEATGYENIWLRSLFLGLSPSDLATHIDEVADVTELGGFLSMPVRTYSSGMMLRLAFAVSTSVVPDILLMDEWIGVGDKSFVAKAQDRLKKLVGRTGILFIASHSEGMIKETCSRVLWLEKGQVRADGSPDDVYRDYNSWSKKQSTA